MNIYLSMLQIVLSPFKQQEILALMIRLVAGHRSEHGSCQLWWMSWGFLWHGRLLLTMCQWHRATECERGVLRNFFFLRRKHTFFLVRIWLARDVGSVIWDGLSIGSFWSNEGNEWFCSLKLYNHRVFTEIFKTLTVYDCSSHLFSINFQHLVGTVTIHPLWVAC